MKKIKLIPPKSIIERDKSEEKEIDNKKLQVEKEILKKKKNLKPKGY